MGQTNFNESIFKYTDYRVFIQSFYDFNKKTRSHFSYRSFAASAGFRSPSFIRDVIEGKKNLSKSSVIKMSKAMNLDQPASEYFEYIVFFAQSNSFEDKKNILTKIDKVHAKNNPAILPPEEYQYLKEWYHPVIREMIDLVNFNESPEAIAKKMLFPVSPGQVKKSLEFLLSKGFIKRDSKNKLQKIEKTLATGDIKDNQVLGVIVRDFHKKFAEIGKRSIDQVSAEYRKTTNTTLSLSKKSYALALERINALRFELLEIAKSEDHAEDIFQLHINMFPLTKIDPPKKKNDF